MAFYRKVNLQNIQKSIHTQNFFLHIPFLTTLFQQDSGDYTFFYCKYFFLSNLFFLEFEIQNWKKKIMAHLLQPEKESGTVFALQLLDVKILDKEYPEFDYDNINF